MCCHGKYLLHQIVHFLLNTNIHFIKSELISSKFVVYSVLSISDIVKGRVTFCRSSGFGTGNLRTLLEMIPRFVFTRVLKVFTCGLLP